MPSINHHVTGIEYWRSLEQLADAPEVLDALDKEFPGYEADTIASSSRRGFLKLMGASLALAGIGLTGCRRWPEEHLAPYSSNPRGRIPGVPEQYATMWELGGVASGLLVTSYDGRPIKIEGNPTHPSSWTVKGKIGSADGFAQASLLEMYDPQRSAKVVARTKTGEKRDSTWKAFESFASKHFGEQKADGSGFAILSESSSSLSVADQKKRLLAAFPKAQWFEYEPLTRDGERDGAKTAFGRPVRPVLHLDKAAIVVTLDADLLSTHPAHVRYAADWSARRRSADPSGEKPGEMSRVYVAECGFSITGSVADERLPIDPSRIYPVAKSLAARLGVTGVTSDEHLSEMEEKWVASAAADLKQAGSAGVVAVGPAAPPHAHALGYAMNQAIGAVGNTVMLVEEQEADRPSHFQAIADLAGQITSGKITTLLIIGGNPAYDAPADLAFAKAIESVPVTVRLGLYEDETSAVCKWHLPRAHYLESWGDARSWDGTAGIVQPLILPLYGGKSAIEILAIFSGESETAGEQIVRRTWKPLLKGDDFDLEFRRVLEAGVLEGSEFPAAKVEPRAVSYPAAEPRRPGLYIRFEPDAHTYDGRFANNGWLQETPDPLTKLLWENAANFSKKDADALGVTTDDVVSISVNGATLPVAVYVLVGQPVGVIGLSLGYGRTVSGNIGNDLGFNTYLLRTSNAPYSILAAEVRKTSESHELVMTQNHHLIDSVGAAGRDKRIGEKYESGKIIHEASFAAYKANPGAALGGRTVGLQLFDPPNQFNSPHAWGMTIDLNTCIGCNACAVACQAENNIPIVGKQQCRKHREMNWIRIDRYFKGAPDDPRPEVIYQPMACQHCENAPCEQVCPVGATMHDSEGLNTMVYNRCIGTRYCSNNCPYKVRRFNYFDYHSQDPRHTGMPWNNLPDNQQMETVDKIKRMVFNPEVTVRMRGVMEKCTYCVQRIHRTATAKRAEGKDVEDGDIITACQQACPTQAIVFGNLNDADAEVTKLQKNPRAYAVLDATLDTRPRTRYLAKIRNPAATETAKEA